MTDDFLRALISFFAIIDPIGNLLVFSLFTRRVGQRKAVLMAVASVAAAAVIIAAFIFGGNEVLDYLGISKPSFQIAAGVLLLFPAYRLVEHGEPSAPALVSEDEHDPVQLAFVPLAIPLIAGPGALATATAFADDLGKETTLAAAGAVLVLTLVLFLLTAVIVRTVGGPALRVMARLVGVLLMAIAVDFILGGLEEVFG